MKTTIKIIILLLMGITLLITFFFPAILSIVTGNWWYSLLFLVSWTPTVGELIIFSGIIKVLDF